MKSPAWARHSELIAHMGVAGLLLIVLPMTLEPFWLGAVGKYLAFA